MIRNLCEVFSNWFSRLQMLSLLQHGFKILLFSKLFLEQYVSHFIFIYVFVFNFTFIGKLALVGKPVPNFLSAS